MRHYLVVGGRIPPWKKVMAVVPSGSRGMKDDNLEVRSATARAMLAERYANMPRFKEKCGYPPCQVIVEGYVRNGKRKLYCSGAHTTAACRLRQQKRGIVRVMRNGVVRTVNLNEVDPGG